MDLRLVDFNRERVFRRGLPVENAWIESFNGGLSGECLDLRSLDSIENAGYLWIRCSNNYTCCHGKKYPQGQESAYRAETSSPCSSAAACCFFHAIISHRMGFYRYLDSQLH